MYLDEFARINLIFELTSYILFPITPSGIKIKNSKLVKEFENLE